MGQVGGGRDDDQTQKEGAPSSVSNAASGSGSKGTFGTLKELDEDEGSEFASRTSVCWRDSWPTCNWLSLETQTLLAELYY